MACEGDLRGPGRAARSSSLRVADTRSSGAQLCAHLRSGLQLRSDTAAHRRRGIIDVVISLRRSNRPHRLNMALAAYGQVALDDLYQRWRVFTDRAVAITQTATVRLTKQVTVDLVLVEIPERALVRQSVSGISYTFITSGAVRQAVGTNGSTNCSGSRGQPASTFRSRRIRRSRSGPPPSVRTAVSCFSRPLWSTSKGDISE